MIVTKRSRKECTHEDTQRTHKNHHFSSRINLQKKLQTEPKQRNIAHKGDWHSTLQG